MKEITRKIGKVSVVISVYNEEEVIGKFWKVCKEELKKLSYAYEVIFVNDGSIDNSLELLTNIVTTEKDVKVINFSRNYGHEAAMIAGIDHCDGDAIICLDADLQHPPSKFREMIDQYSKGNDVITMVRTKNHDVAGLKSFASKSFYKLFNKISPVKLEPNASDFFLISRKVATVLRQDFRERARFLRGFIQIVGFRKTTVEFVAPERAGGTSKYSLFKLFKFSISALTSFSNLPLHLGIIAGTITGIISILIGIYSIICKLLNYALPGYTTIVVLITFLFAVQLFITGIIGEYIGYLFTEQKKRPIYIIDEIINK